MPEDVYLYIVETSEILSDYSHFERSDTVGAGGRSSLRAGGGMTMIWDFSKVAS